MKSELNTWNVKWVTVKEMHQWGCYMEMDNKVSTTQTYCNLCSKTASFDHEGNNHLNQQAKSGSILSYVKQDLVPHSQDSEWIQNAKLLYQRLKFNFFYR